MVMVLSTLALSKQKIMTPRRSQHTCGCCWEPGRRRVIWQEFLMVPKDSSESISAIECVAIHFELLPQKRQDEILAIMEKWAQ